MGVEQGMSNEVAVRLVLDQLAKEKTVSGWSWDTFKRNNLKKNQAIAISLGFVERAVELGFVAGQKAKKKRFVKELEEMEDYLNRDDIRWATCPMDVIKEAKKRVGGEKKDE